MHAVRLTLAAVLLLVAGCGEEPTGEGDPEDDAAPALGACRVLEPADIAEPADQSPTVDCAEPHTAETYAVGSFPDELADAEWDDRELGAFAYDTCSKAFAKFTGADESVVLRSLLSWAWFRPTEKGWADGQRWYRCDVVGGSEESRQLIELPRTAKGLLVPTPADEWMQCVRGDAVPGAPRVACSEPHDWRAVTTIKVGKPGDPYPGDRIVEVTTRDFCDDSVSAWLGYPLQYTFAYSWFHEAEWKAGNRRSVCWARTPE